MAAAPSESRLRHLAAYASLGIGVLILVIKWTAYIWTGSATVLSDALESVVHVVAVGFMVWCLRFAAAPPDAGHPYGHGKAEYLSVGVEGGAIVCAALAIFYEAIVNALHHHVPEAMGRGLLLITGAGAINVVLGVALLAIGRRTRSLILVADGQHVLSDVWTSLGVIGGILLMLVVPPQARPWCDAAVAMAMGVLILSVGWRLIRQASDGLMDATDPDGLVQVVAAINEIRDPAWVDIHNLRLRSSGEAVFIDFHLVVPADWNVANAHQAVERLEHHILERLQRPGTVLVHLDHPPVGGAGPPLTVPPEPFEVAHATRLTPRYEHQMQVLDAPAASASATPG